MTLTNEEADAFEQYLLDAEKKVEAAAGKMCHLPLESEELRGIWRRLISAIDDIQGVLGTTYVLRPEDEGGAE